MGKPTRRVQDLTGGEGTSTDEPSDAAVDVDDVSMDVDTELIAKPSVKAPVAASGKTPGTVPSKAGVTATAVKPRPMLKK